MNLSNPALGRTRGATCPLRVAFRRAPHSPNVRPRKTRTLLAFCIHFDTMARCSSS